MLLISQVRVKLVDRASKLKAFAEIVIDGVFLVHNLKILVGDDGHAFIGMPNRKVTYHCPSCAYKNPLAAHYCSRCGSAISPENHDLREYEDIAHPLDAATRTYITEQVLAEYERELKRNVAPVCSPEPFDSALVRPDPESFKNLHYGRFLSEHEKAEAS